MKKNDSMSTKKATYEMICRALIGASHPCLFIGLSPELSNEVTLGLGGTELVTERFLLKSFFRITFLYNLNKYFYSSNLYTSIKD